MRRVLAALAAVSLPVLALAQDTTAVALDSIGSLLEEAFRAAQRGDWKLTGIFAALLVTLLLRQYGAALIPSLKTDLGGTVLATVGTPLAGLAAAGMAGVPVTRELVVGAFSAAAGSSVAWQVWRRAILGFLVPVVTAQVRKIPVVGPIAANFIERPLGSLLDAARAALLKKAQAKPELATATAKSTAVVEPAVAPDAPASTWSDSVGQGISDADRPPG